MCYCKIMPIMSYNEQFLCTLEFLFCFSIVKFCIPQLATMKIKLFNAVKLILLVISRVFLYRYMQSSDLDLKILCSSDFYG